MKKIAFLALFALLLPLQACAQEEGVRWKEGTHYKVLNEAATEEPTITEFFSFWCPHCFSFEPLVKQIKDGMNPNTKFEKVHVDFMGGVSAELQQDATKAMLIGRALKQEDALNGAIFNYIHKQRAPVTSNKDLRNIFTIAGVEGEKFDKLEGSFGVNSQLKKNQKMLEDYRQYVSSVPAFIINGKYQPTYTRDMTMDDIVDLVVYLSNKK